ncbi:uncharacterized protein BJX67DRAFT_244243 [Aspergillus lucknowensis]|uniref:Uncharacterized protein n=1 Tax=Aspergillus lucknowensis TaxID=176173 RepID=A0ABR4M1Y5_9EURO
MPIKSAIGRQNHANVGQCDSLFQWPALWGVHWVAFCTSWRDRPTVPDRSIAYFKLASGWWKSLPNERAITTSSCQRRSRSRGQKDRFGVLPTFPNSKVDDFVAFRQPPESLQPYKAFSVFENQGTRTKETLVISDPRKSKISETSYQVPFHAQRGS